MCTHEMTHSAVHEWTKADIQHSAQGPVCIMAAARTRNGLHDGRLLEHHHEVSVHVGRGEALIRLGAQHAVEHQ